MIHSIKGKQVKLLATVLGGIFSIAMLVLIFKSGNAETKGVEKYYEKSISTGVDGLSEKEMWIEKSTNELNELKKQNKDLQEQLDKIQKVVVGIGKAMHVWEGVPGNGDNVSGDTVSDAENIKNMDKAISDENFAKPKAEVSQAPTISLMQDFVKTSNQAKPFTEITQDAPKVKPDYDKLRRSRIKTISFSNAGTEYDLDENFIFATTYARCVLLGSVTVSAGVGASSNPQPVLLRLTDAGNLPNNVRGFLKDAVVIGAAYGELSSESVVIRLERIVKIDIPPVLVLALCSEGCRLVQDIITNGNVESAVAVTRVGAPRVINMKSPRRVKALALAPDFKPIMSFKLYPDMSASELCDLMKTSMGNITVEGLTGTITWDLSTLYRIASHHRRRYCAVEPATL